LQLKLQLISAENWLKISVTAVVACGRKHAYHNEEFDMTTKEAEKEQPPCEKAEPQEEHKWLAKLVGKWTIESECQMGPGDKPMKTKGHETVRMLGDVWIVCEGEMEAPGGEIGKTMMTVGFDPKKRHFVGTWVGSMMHNMWVYEGDLDAAKKVLPLNTVGPDFLSGDTTKETKYQDIIEIVDNDNRILRSQSSDRTANGCKSCRRTTSARSRLALTAVK